MLATLVMVAIYAVDRFSHLEVGIPTLYIAVIGLVGRDGSEKEIRIWTCASVALAFMAWLQVHLRAPDFGSAIRLLFACMAILLTCGLLINRRRYQRSQAELEMSRADLQNFSDSVPQLLWRTLPDGRVDYFNRRYTEMTGHDAREAIEKQNWGEWFHPDDFPHAMELYQGALAGNSGDELRIKFRMLFADGTYRWMSLVGRGVRDPQTGGYSAWYGGTSDVHDEVLAQNAVTELNGRLEQRVEERTNELFKIEHRMATLFEMSNITYAEQDLSETLPILDAIRSEGITDLSGYMDAHPEVLDRCISTIRNVRVNSALARLLGYRDADDLAATPPVQNANDAKAVLLRQLEMAFYGLPSIEGRTVLIGKNGIRVPVFFNVHRLSDERQLSSHIDVTGQERIEEMRFAAQAELARANRVATVGAFSASIAHELNQPIASMSMDVQTAKRVLNVEAPDIALAQRILDRLARTTERVAGIVQNTRAQVAKGNRSAEAIDVSLLVVQTIELLEREIRNAKAQVRYEVRCEGCLVWGDRIGLQQVLINLLSNAMDAMAQTPERDRIVDISVVREGGHVTIVVADHGPGIAEDQIDRLFQPFFTTKPNGVGMGLQICRSTVESLGGDLRASSRAGGGAVFECGLPIYEEASGPAQCPLLT